jgi:hypothetical protein
LQAAFQKRIIIEKDSLDGIPTLPNHGDDWTRVHVLDKTWEEFLVLEVGVVLLEVFLSWRKHLKSDELIGRRSRKKQRKRTKKEEKKKKRKSSIRVLLTIPVKCQRTYLVTPLLEPGDDLSGQATLNGVRLWM